jgi:DNA-binding winged helix-turn-helix (wHTH) protein/Tol biopolymer transport system component
MPDQFKIGPWAVDVELNTVRRGDRVIRLEPKVMEVCACLANRAGKVVRKEELIRAVWRDTIVTEDVLTHAISELRKVLEDDARQPSFIETIPKRGYRLIAVVGHEQLDLSKSSLPAAPGKLQPNSALWATWRRGSAVLLLGAGILAAIAFVATVVWRLPRISPPQARPVEEELTPIPIVTYGDGGQWLPAFSPDGSRVAYSWNKGDALDFSWYLEVKVLGSDTRLRLTKQPAAFPPGPAWSPDGREIAFVRAGALDDRGIFIISALGGPERKLRSLASWQSALQRVVSWSPDGRWIAFADEAGTPTYAKPKDRGPNALYLISPETSETRQLTTPAADELGDSSPMFSPDGTTIAFVHTTAESRDEICTIPVQGGTPHRLDTSGIWTNGLAWTADGQSIVFDRSHVGGFSLWRVRSTGGEPHRLALPADRKNTLAPTIWQERLAYEAHEDMSTVGRISLSKPLSGLPQTPIASTRRDHAGRYSPHGDRIAFLSERTGTDELWIADADGANPFQLTHFGVPLFDLSWAPDGRSVAVTATPGRVYVIPLETGSPRLIFNGEIFSSEVDPKTIAFSRDGRFLYVMSQRGKRYELLKVPIVGGAPVKVLDGLFTNFAESADGHTLFYSRRESSVAAGAPGIWKRVVEGGAEQYVANFSDTWDLGPDGLYLVNHNASAIERYSLSGKRLQTVAKIGQFDLRPPISISPDRHWAIFNYPLHGSVEIEMVQGFK